MDIAAVTTNVGSVQRQYEFRVSGRLSERTRDAVGDFSEMRIVPAPPETILYGAVTDQAHLHGILTFLESLGLQIVSVHQLPEQRSEGSAGSRA
jgi:hypothetical protein